MSVHRRKLASGKVQHIVRWRENGRNRSRAFDDPKTARDFDRELTRLRQAGELAAELQRRRITVADLVDEWADRVAPTLAKHTRDQYAVQLDHRILPQLGERPVAQLTVAEVERWVQWMREDGGKLGPTGNPTILKACAVLQAVLTLGVRDGVVAVNVARSARKPRQGRTRLPYLIKPIAVERMRAFLLARGQDRDAMLLELLAYAGLRPESEAVALRWGQVRDRSLLVADTKRGRERTVTVPAALRESLRTWRRQQGRPGADALVVPNLHGQSWSSDDWRTWRRRRFAAAARAAGLPADTRPRDLRGSFVSLLIHEGQNIVQVAGQVGHSPTICLRDYAQAFAEHKPGEVVSADTIISRARFAVRVASMREWATNIEPVCSLPVPTVITQEGRGA